ncbi:cytochrome c biogenesis CcdA family protein [Thermogemmatispora sp.]|uniref:cytochrome c biogenesis CcdA family protein n=1 Tax=Thermogemmatispora sp. TaxID=1968838 RepID=UPI0035E46196
MKTVLLWQALIPLPTGDSLAVALSLAFGAGLLSPLNPCGLALLPALVAGLVSRQAVRPSQRGASATLQGGLLALPLTGDYLVSFLLAGIGLALGGRLLLRLFPWLALLVGASFILGGAWSLWSGRALELPGLGQLAAQLTPRSASDRSDRQRRAEGLRTAWFFGLGYGLASLGCAFPIFLLMVGTALTRGSLAEAALVLVSYAAGMALLLGGVTLAATVLGDLVRALLRPLSRWLPLISALLLMGVGLWIIWYWLRAGLW